MSVTDGVPAAADARALRALESVARSAVDYALVRRSTLAAFAAGRVARREVCDAQTYLLRAARYHGHDAGMPCPVCTAGNLTYVCYTYGDGFRSDANGRARAPRELLEMARSQPDFTAYLVEVCAECRWNHLVAAYVLGTGEPARRRRARS